MDKCPNVTDNCISQYATLGERVFGHSHKVHLRSPLFWPRTLRINHAEIRIANFRDDAPPRKFEEQMYARNWPGRTGNPGASVHQFLSTTT